MALIPFAFSNILNKLVDVDEVENGKKCNCICPSCKMTLNAKQGEVNEHHFAHAHKAETICHYSYWVSVRDMAKQILLETKYIHLDLGKSNNLSKIPYAKNQTWIRVLHVKKGKNGFALELDTSIGKLDVCFKTPEDAHRECDFTKSLRSQNLILEIDLIKMNSRENKYKECLKAILIDSNTSKKLLTHKLKKPEKAFILSRDMFQNMLQDTYRGLNKNTTQKQVKSEPIKEKVFCTNSIIKELHLDLRTITNKRKNVIVNMQPFYEKCMKTYRNVIQDDGYSEIYAEGVYELISFKSRYYAIANVDGIYVLYTFNDAIFNKVGSSMDYRLLIERFQRDYKEAESLF